jgi:hypothetical protein
LIKFFIFCFIILSVPISFAEDFTIQNANLREVFLNAGQDASNSGTTCFKLENTISLRCIGGFIAVKNNNSVIISSLLHAKATGKPVWIYYDDNQGSNHCPGLVFTPCVINSIGLN